jgi:hypothetical protein
MDLTNQSDLPVFFSFRKVNLKIYINSGLRQAIARARNLEDGFRLLWFHQTLF